MGAGARPARRTMSRSILEQLGLPPNAVPDPVEASEILHISETEAAPPPLSVRSEAARRLRVFYDVARAVSQLEDTSAVLGRMLEATLDVLGCERGVIGLREPGGALSIQQRIVRSRDPESAGDVVISRSLLEATLGRRAGVIACDKMRARTMLEHKILSAMAVPLTLGPDVIGLIYVDERVKDARFAAQDLDFLSALSHLTAAALESAERYQRAAAAVEVLSAESAFGELWGVSEAMRSLKGEIQKFAASSRAHILIRGESGTGKELVARTLHALSPRKDKPLVTLNCAAMPETMIESELFGHVKGAFSGAVSDKRGKFVMADKGTLFLDEIGDLSLSAQAKVLRAVQQGEVQPLGSERTLRVDVRILSATHKNLAAEIAAGRFREDLLYRLNVLELCVPPLRDRVEDIPDLAQIFLAASAAEMGKRVVGFTPRALKALSQYGFPGNVRELKNEVERAVIVVEGGDHGERATVVDVGDLSTRITGRSSRTSAPHEAPRPLSERYGALEQAEEAMVKEALEQAKGNVAEAARLLGISRSRMKTRMDRFGAAGSDA
jgi:Nif-specific regulatory protein